MRKNSFQVSDNCFWAELVDKLKKPSENELDHSELPPAADLETNVHSFGIMLLEIISGRVSYMQDQGHITNWVYKHTCKIICIICICYLLIVL